MTVRGVVSVGVGLWLTTHVVAGVKLAPDLDPLAAVGTLLVIALLLSVVDLIFVGVRRAVWLATESVPVAVAATVLLNAALFWSAGNLARAAGLGFAVTGAVAALAGSLLVRLAARTFASIISR